MEGAGPSEDPSQRGAWTGMGVRIVGPAWGGTRYSGGPGAPGGLTELGRQLLKAMRRKKVLLDLSHMAQEAPHAPFHIWRARSLAPLASPRSPPPFVPPITPA